MRMSIRIDDFPLELLDNFNSQLSRYTDCTFVVTDNTVEVSCADELVHLMEVLAVADLYSMAKSVSISKD